jgi:hypothetical protein
MTEQPLQMLSCYFEASLSTVKEGANFVTAALQLASGINNAVKSPELHDVLSMLMLRVWSQPRS